MVKISFILCPDFLKELDFLCVPGFSKDSVDLVLQRELQPLDRDISAQLYQFTYKFPGDEIRVNEPKSPPFLY